MLVNEGKGKSTFKEIPNGSKNWFGTYEPNWIDELWIDKRASKAEFCVQDIKFEVWEGDWWVVESYELKAKYWIVSLMDY